MNRKTLFDRLADLTVLDGVAGKLRTAVAKVLKQGPVKDALHGVWLGHALHPALAQMPVGCYTAVAVLDATGCRGGAQERLIGAGLLASVPTAAAGLADYSATLPEQQRIGLVHATANGVASGCYLTSLVLRLKGRRGAGIASGMAGFGVAMLGAALGGDLSYRHAVGANHDAEVPHTGPSDWCDLGPATDFRTDDPQRRMAGETPVLVLRNHENGTGVTVLHDRCSHLSGPLHEGRLSGTDGDQCLTCPWHGSVFRVSDGAVVHGPATAPLPVLDSRVVAGRLQVKAQQYPS